MTFTSFLVLAMVFSAVALPATGTLVILGMALGFVLKPVWLRVVCFGFAFVLAISMTSGFWVISQFQFGGSMSDE